MSGTNFGPAGGIRVDAAEQPTLAPAVTLTLDARLAATVKEPDLEAFDTLVFCDTPEVVVERRALQALVAAVRAARADPATLRHHADQLAKSLELTLDILDRVRRGESFTIEASLGNTQTTETAHERLKAWREGPGAETKGGGNG